MSLGQFLKNQSVIAKNEPGEPICNNDDPLFEARITYIHEGKIRRITDDGTLEFLLKIAKDYENVTEIYIYKL